MSEIKLLPCPFCGGEAKTFQTEPFTQVVCTKCGSRIERIGKELAAQIWNTRKPMENIIHSIELARDCTPNEDFKSGCNASLHKIWMEIL